MRLTNEAKVFAPANLRCAAQNLAYAALVNTWIEAAFTLRYTGGMVPDVHGLISRGGGVFCCPASQAAPAKLRLVYECAPLALVVEVRVQLQAHGCLCLAASAWLFKFCRFLSLSLSPGSMSMTNASHHWS